MEAFDDEEMREMFELANLLCGDTQNVVQQQTPQQNDQPQQHQQQNQTRYEDYNNEGLDEFIDQQKKKIPSVVPTRRLISFWTG